MSNFISGRIVCPFFNDIRSQAILCEGINNNTSLHLAFKNKYMQKKYIEEYCCDNYKKCRIAKMLLDKYDGV